MPLLLLTPTNSEFNPKCERFCSFVNSPTYPVPLFVANKNLKNSSSSSAVLAFTTGAYGDL